MSLRVVVAALALLPCLLPSAQAQNYFRPSYRLPFSMPLSPYAPRYLDRDEWQGQQAQGTYRTLCVRLCDGFYFPISFATPSYRLDADADKCRASCGGEARLFYYPNPGGDIESMTDLTGFAYASLPNAFKYRRTFVQGCQCKPEPWSEAEAQRHRAYALNESRVPPQRAGVTTTARPAPPAGEPTAVAGSRSGAESPSFDPALRPLTRWATPPPSTAAPREPEAAGAPEPIDQDALRQPEPLPRPPAFEPQRRRKAAPPLEWQPGRPAAWKAGGYPSYVWPGDPAPRR
jgi:hypothetical protein